MNNLINKNQVLEELNKMSSNKEISIAHLNSGEVATSKIKNLINWIIDMDRMFEDSIFEIRI